MINGELITYQDDSTILEGFLATDTSWQEKRPAVILCHAWNGKDEFVCQKARDIARLGYVGFALDIYGKGILGKTKEENAGYMMPFMKDRKRLQKRLLAAFETVRKQEAVAKNQIAVMGFCFGGLCALDLARSGAEVKGAISVHGLLIPAEGISQEKIQSKVLALHGHDDPLVPPEQVAGFEKEMTDRKVDWQIHVYGNTMHAFTHPGANDPHFGTVYNRVAAKRAWASIKIFLQEVFENNF